MTAEGAARTIADLITGPSGRSPRRIVALAGPPASGKSTTAEALVAELERRALSAVILPMDGFHLDNAILHQRGLIERKGSPASFDLAGFQTALRRIQAEPSVVVPIFDRARDMAVAGSREVRSDHDVVIVEGNYLLLDAPGWRDLAAIWDLAVFLPVPEADLVARLIGRWTAHGLDPDAARARALQNDIPNARLVLETRLPADLDLD